MITLPILWGYEPTGDDWKRLTAARASARIEEMIRPATALQGSPAPILCIGARPTWVTDFAYVDTTEDDDLADALLYCLEGEHAGREREVELLSEWFGAPVTYVGDEVYDGV